jgi:hypothetical protein
MDMRWIIGTRTLSSHKRPHQPLNPTYYYYWRLNMKLTPYRQALKYGKEKLGELMVPVKVNKAKKQAELEMCKLDEEIATSQVSLHDLCTQEEVNFPAIIAIQDKLGLLARKREQYEAILSQMFPDDDEVSKDGS